MVQTSLTVFDSAAERFRRPGAEKREGPAFKTVKLDPPDLNHV
jgi:hypothetical protein